MKMFFSFLPAAILAIILLPCEGRVRRDIWPAPSDPNFSWDEAGDDRDFYNGENLWLRPPRFDQPPTFDEPSRSDEPSMYNDLSSIDGQPRFNDHITFDHPMRFDEPSRNHGNHREDFSFGGNGNDRNQNNIRDEFNFGGNDRNQNNYRDDFSFGGNGNDRNQNNIRDDFSFGGNGNDRNQNRRTTTEASGPITSTAKTIHVAPQGCECPMTQQFNPVCGTDGNTYRNKGLLNCYARCGSNVSQKRLGIC